MTTQTDLGQLSDRELEVLKLVATGATNQQIARALAISPNTVKVHLRNIFEKLGVQSRTEATMEAVRRGWVPVSSAVLGEAATTPAPEAVPPAIPLAEAPARPALTPWHRAYFILALVVVIVAALAPVWWQGTTRAAPSTPFSDRGQPQADRAPRVDVARWSAVAALPTARSRLAVVAAEGSDLRHRRGEYRGRDGRDGGLRPCQQRLAPGPQADPGCQRLSGDAERPSSTCPAARRPPAGSRMLEVYDVAARLARRRNCPGRSQAMPWPRWTARCLFGGWTPAVSRGDVHLRPSREAWTEGIPLPAPRAAAAALDKRIFVAGGFDGQAG